MEDDCWLPGLCRKVSDACLSAELTAECENTDNLRNGIDRPTDEASDNGCFVPLNSDITYTLKANTYIENVHIVFDSDLNRETVKGGIPIVKDCPTICNRPLDLKGFSFPETVTKVFELIADGEIIYSTDCNHQRFVKIKVKRTVKRLILRPIATFGAEKAHIFSFDF